MKNKKKIILVGGIALAVIVAIILCIVLTPKGSKPTDDKKPNTSDVSGDGVVVDDPEKEEKTEPTVLKPDGIADNGTGLQAMVESGNTDSVKTGGKKANETAKPISGSGNYNDEGTTGIVIGGGEGKKYDCGVAGHHCDGPETHAYILNLELEGCQYCGSHSCPSFYATDEWGHTCYTPSKCPKYNVHSDPVYYCQNCGKKCGDGTGGTCVQFVNACNCPSCGKYVEAISCHSCN